MTPAKFFSNVPGMNTAKDIADQIGRHRLAALLNVSTHSIRYAVTAGKFPASWYLPMKQHCEENGIACDAALFNFKTAGAADAV